MAFQGRRHSSGEDGAERSTSSELRPSKLSEQGMAWDRVERRMPPVRPDDIVVIVKRSRRAVAPMVVVVEKVMLLSARRIFLVGCRWLPRASSATYSHLG